MQPIAAGLKSMHILLIEPDTLLAATYKAALEASKHTVTWTRTAQQAVFAADEQKPSVVVLEPQMARHNGIEFLYEFKSYPEWQAIPIVILTMLPTAELEGLAVLRRDLGVAAILGKSQTSLPQLCEAVAEAAKAKP